MARLDPRKVKRLGDLGAAQRTFYVLLIGQYQHRSAGQPLKRCTVSPDAVKQKYTLKHNTVTH